MRTVTIFKQGKSQVVRLPADMAYEGVEELEISREGDVISLRPVRPSWTSFSWLPKADAGFLQERPVVIVTDKGRPAIEARRYKADQRSPLERLRGSVIELNDPFEPVDEEDWV